MSYTWQVFFPLSLSHSCCDWACIHSIFYPFWPKFSLQSLQAEKRFSPYSWESKLQMLSSMITSTKSNLTIRMAFKFLPCWWKVKPLYSHERVHVVNEYSLPFFSSFTDMCSTEWVRQQQWMSSFQGVFNKRWGIWYTIFNKESAIEIPLVMFKSFLYHELI